MRLFLAIFVAGIGIAAATAIVTTTGEERCTRAAKPGTSSLRAQTCADDRPGWALPVGILVGFLGVGAGAAIGRPRE